MSHCTNRVVLFFWGIFFHKNLDARCRATTRLGAHVGDSVMHPYSKVTNFGELLKELLKNQYDRPFLNLLSLHCFVTRLDQGGT